MDFIPDFSALQDGPSGFYPENGRYLQNSSSHENVKRRRVSLSNTVYHTRNLLLTEKPTDPIVYVDDGNTPLHQAILCDCEVAVRECLKNKANINKVNKQGQSGLHLAVVKSSFTFVTLLLEHDCDVNIQNSNQNTALHHAIFFGNNGIVDLLIDHPKTDLRLRNIQGCTILHMAAMIGNDVAVEKILEKAADLVSVRNNDGNTALHLAVGSEHFEIAKMLLEQSVLEINVCNRLLETPLLLAAKNGHCVEVELLVHHGADIHLKDMFGNSGVHLALFNERIERDIMLTDAPEISKIYADLGAICDIKRSRGLLIACFLVQKGANLQGKNHLQKTPLDSVSSLATQELLRNFAWRNTNSDREKECMMCDATDLVPVEPCGHCIVCESCSSKLKKCLFCSAKLTKESQEETGDEELSSMVQAIEDENRDLKNKMKEIQEDQNCPICLERPKNVAFLCGHRACSDCAKKLKFCHMCRKPVLGSINLY